MYQIQWEDCTVFLSWVISEYLDRIFLWICNLRWRCVREKGWSCIHPSFLSEPHAMKTYWKSGSKAPRILELDTRWSWVVSFTPQPLYPQRKSPSYPFDRRLVGSCTGLDAVVKRKIPSPYRHSKLNLDNNGCKWSASCLGEWASHTRCVEFGWESESVWTDRQREASLPLPEIEILSSIIIMNITQFITESYILASNGRT
jgi:hypothetical protein